MTVERSTQDTWNEHPGQKSYDEFYYRKLIEHIKGDVLDIGSGAGMFIQEYAKGSAVKSVVAVDKFDGERLQHEKVENIVSKALDFKTDKKFNTIVSTEFIEHITKEDFLKLLENIKGMLKDDGLFIGSTPNKIRPTTNQFHLYEYTLGELADILKAHFHQVDVYADEFECIIFVCRYCR